MGKAAQLLREGRMFSTLWRIVSQRFRREVRSQQKRWHGWRVEQQGNLVKYEGLIFNVDNPTIPSGLKGVLALGAYERPEIEAVKAYLDGTLSVIELGGGMGVVSSIINRKLNHPERHIVIEANPSRIPLIEDNRDRNGGRFTVLNRAFGYDGQTIDFRWADEIHSSTRIQGSPTVAVETISLASILEQTGFEHFSLIADIEGTEIDLIKREIEILKERAALFIVEFHPNITEKAVLDQAWQTLAEAGFECVGTDKFTSTFLNNRFRHGTAERT